MIKSLQSIVLAASILSVSLFGNRNIGLTKEIDRMRESILCEVESTFETKNEQTDAQDTLGYSDGFWVDEEETVYLLATYDCEVLEYRRGAFRTISLPEAVLPADIVSFDDRLYIFDDILSEVQCYTKQGEFLFRTAIELTGDYVKQLTVIGEEILLRTYGGQEFLLEAETGALTVRDYYNPVLPTLPDYDFAEYIASDEDGTIYAVYTKLVKNCSVLSGELTLLAFSPEGDCTGTYVFPTEEYAYLPDAYVQVLKNGNVYVLLTGKQTVKVCKIALHEQADSKLTELADAAKKLEEKYRDDTSYRKRAGLACTEQVTLSREQVWQRALAMAEYTWTLRKTNTLVSKSEPGVVLSGEIEAAKKKNEGTSGWKEVIKGIPYCWGGFYALDTGFKGNTFQKVIDNGYVAGNINATGYLKYMTAGLDCSGYVSAALGFTKKQSTSGLNDIGSSVKNVKKLQQMDLLIHPGDHVIFFCGFLDEATMLVAESAVREGKVSVHPKSINELAVSGAYQMKTPW